MLLPVSEYFRSLKQIGSSPFYSTPKTALPCPTATYDIPGLSGRCPKAPISAYFGVHFCRIQQNGAQYADFKK